MPRINPLPSGSVLYSLEGPDEQGRIAAKAQNFVVEWIDSVAGPLAAESGDELLLILPRGAAEVGIGERSYAFEGPAAAIAPPGKIDLTLTCGGPLILVATDRPDLRQASAGFNPENDPRIAPIGHAFERQQPLADLLVAPFDSIANPAGNPRIRFLQTATMSVNIVRYDGPRDSTSLSPHAHTDLQQGTLALAGRYVHHLRTPWGKDVADWREDEHIEAGPGTLLLIPPEVIHTTQGIGEEPHLLIDIFAPPRRDFIAKGWVANSSEYRDLEDQSGR